MISLKNYKYFKALIHFLKFGQQAMVLLEELSRMESELAERPQSQTEVDERGANEV